MLDENLDINMKLEPPAGLFPVFMLSETERNGYLGSVWK